MCDNLLNLLSFVDCLGSIENWNFSAFKSKGIVSIKLNFESLEEMKQFSRVVAVAVGRTGSKVWQNK